MFKHVFSNQESAEQETRPLQKVCDINQYVRLLEPGVQPFASAFFSKFSELLPSDFALDWDRNAPDNPEKERRAKGDRLSMEFNLWRDAMRFKYGTGRVAMRGKFYFAKTVTWKTPKDFLHQLPVYEIIKNHFYDCRIVKNRSKSRNGFTVKNKNKVITLEVFGDNPKSGYLACDITLSRFNQPMAQQRVQRFLDFYGDLYNHLNNSELKFTTKPFTGLEFPELLP